MPSKNTHMQSPFQLLYRTPPEYHHLRVFGCSCYPWQRPLQTHKLSARAPHCIFIGYSDNSKGYKCHNISTGKTIISRHVTFDESSFPFTHSSPNSPPTPPKQMFPASLNTSPFPPPIDQPSSQFINSPPLPTVPIQETEQTTIPPNHPISTSSSPINTTIPPPENQPPPHPMVTRLKSGITKPKHIFTLLHTNSAESAPNTYKQAIQSPDWRQAMTDEFSALQQQSTWTLVPPPPDHNIIGCRWTFRLKYNADGTVARHKARLVAQGFTQEYGLDYNETFSPVARITTIRLFLTIAVYHRWEILQFDVSNAFLHGHIDELLYMHQPPGFLDKQFPNHVCLLHKAIYGLKQSPRLWYSTFSKFLQRHGFQVSSADPSLLLYSSPTTHIYLILYVDDILIAGDDASFIANLQTNLHKHFQLKALGKAHNFLGIQITPTPTGLFLNQESYVHEILHTAGLQNCNPAPTPSTIKSTHFNDHDVPFNQPTHYRRLAGSLQYLTITRPDIAHAVNLICQYMHSPTQQHFQLLKRILRYLQATPSHGLPITTSPLTLHAYSDADWAGDINTRRSTTGYCIFLGATLISWKVHKQKTVARSSTEAEYRALAATTTEIIWLRRLITEFGHPPSTPTPLFCDNTSAIALAKNPIFHARTKHIEVDFHFVRDHINNKQLILHHLPTEEQTADILTKPHTRIRFNHLRSKLTVRHRDHDFDGG